MRNVGNVGINKNASRIFLVIVVLVMLIGLISSTIIFVPPDETGVVVSRITRGGYRPEPLQSGLHFVVPFLENVEKYSKAKQTYTMSAAISEGQRGGDDSIRARTNDGQEVFVDASVIYAINPANVVDLHITWQDRYGEELVRPLVRGVIRDAASQYGIEEIVSSKRGELEAFISEQLTLKMAENDLVLEDFVLRDIHFSEEYAAAVEQKQIAEQQAFQAKFVVESKRQEAEQARQIAQGQADAIVIAAKGDAEARLINAEAEARANELIAASLRDNPELLTYQYITRLSPTINTILVPSDNPYILPIPSSNTPVPNVTTP
ncbi:MAG: prohibitin family protein [Anaerolineales bacterium]|nr:prohibitin family protein [Anaerolineales bacterium]